VADTTKNRSLKPTLMNDDDWSSDDDDDGISAAAAAVLELHAIDPTWLSSFSALRNNNNGSSLSDDADSSQTANLRHMLRYPNAHVQFGLHNAVPIAPNVPASPFLIECASTHHASPESDDVLRANKRRNSAAKSADDDNSNNNDNINVDENQSKPAPLFPRQRTTLVVLFTELVLLRKMSCFAQLTTTIVREYFRRSISILRRTSIHFTTTRSNSICHRRFCTVEFSKSIQSTK
jgi:hypothetical protein